jgi:hypothetical protein
MDKWKTLASKQWTLIVLLLSPALVIVAHLGAWAGIAVYIALTGDHGKHLSIQPHVISALIGGSTATLGLIGLIGLLLWWCKRSKCQDADQRQT